MSILNLIYVGALILAGVSGHKDRLVTEFRKVEKTQKTVFLAADESTSPSEEIVTVTTETVTTKTVQPVACKRGPLRAAGKILKGVTHPLKIFKKHASSESSGCT